MSDPTFEEIAAKHGKEAAIRAGIAADPDTLELNEEWFAKARPVSEAHPQIVEAFRRRNPSPLNTAGSTAPPR